MASTILNLSLYKVGKLNETSLNNVSKINCMLPANSVKFNCFFFSPFLSFLLPPLFLFEVTLVDRYLVNRGFDNW